MKIPEQLRQADRMYDWFLIREVYTKRIKEAVKLIGDNPGEVCDIGCGHGILIEQLGRKGIKAKGVDQSEIYIKNARKNLDELRTPYKDLQVGNVLDLPFADNSLDVITILDVLEHIPEVVKALEELKRILRPGGKLIISVPTENLWYGIARFFLRMKKPIDHYHTAEQIENIIPNMMDIVKTKNIYPVFNFFRIIVAEK